MSGFEFTSQSEQQTRELGQSIGTAIDKPCVIYLDGTLGAGKTRFVQAVASGLDINPDTVTSPTFTLIVPHEGRLPLVHIDAYRIKDLDEADQLGIDDWAEAGSVLMIEWADRIATSLPPADIKIQIEHLSDSGRKFIFELPTSLGRSICGQLQLDT